MNNELEISHKFQPLFDLLEDYNYKEVDTIIMTGGRYSYKSYTVSIFSLIALVNYSWNVLYTRFTNNSITDSIKPEVSNKIELLGFQNQVSDTNTHIETKENRISFKGIKTGSKAQTANLKSLSGFNCFVIDEAEETPDYATFKKVFYSIRSTIKRNVSILILNPTTSEHWIYQEFFEKRGVEAGSNLVKDNVMYIHTSYLDGNLDIMPKNILSDYKKLQEEDPDEYDNIVGGGWITEPEGVLLPKSKINFDNIEKYKLEDTCYKFALGDPANTGGDNYSMLFIWVYIVENKLSVVVKDIIYSKNGIESLTDTIKDKLREHFIEDTFLEVNGVGVASYLLLKKEIENHTTIKPFTTTENKEAKILSNFEFIKKYFTFDKNYKSNTEHNQFITHLTSYSKEGDNKHKLDAIDNASMVSKVLKTKYKTLLYG